MHNYVGPGSPLPTSSRAAVLGEFGGLGLRVDGHRFVPEEDFCYELQGNSAQLEVRAAHNSMGNRGWAWDFVAT